MATVQRLAAHVRGPIAPDRQHVKLGPSLPTWSLRHVAAPEDEDGTGELPASVHFVVLQIELNAPVIEASRADRVWVAETTQVFGVRLACDGAIDRSPTLEQKVQIHLGTVADQRFRKGRWLTHQMPVKPGEGELAIHVIERGLGRTAVAVHYHHGQR
jgi:hypothetical protein